jgi:hypothetical protein
MTQTLVCPRPPARKAALTLAHRRSTLAGRSVGVLSNGKPNADAFLEAVGTLLRAGAGVRDVGYHRKPSWSRRAPDDVIRQLAQYDAVITAVGD